jgi:hypothetical protein
MQTAVEWLATELNRKMNILGDFTIFHKLLHQAKEMEREQSQPEISDEEIEKTAYEWCKGIGEDGYIRTGDDYDISELPAFIAGAKWYKEQLKQNK